MISPELVPLALCLLFLLGVLLGLFTGVHWYADFRQESRLVELRNQWREAEAAAKAGVERMEQVSANVQREIAAAREFVALWNYGAKDEAVDVLRVNNLPFTFTEDRPK